jgi:hypothetical protein
LIATVLRAPRAHKALRSFYAASDRKNARDRPQQILTPPYLLKPLLQVWGKIALDPCAHRASPVKAARRIYGRRKRDDTERGWHWTGRGLLEPWDDRTYANPPFENLHWWSLKAQREGCSRRVALLAPFRTQRVWLRAVARSCGVLALDPVRFVGYGSGFPAALALLYWGADVRAVFAEYERAELGQTLWYQWGKSCR